MRTSEIFPDPELAVWVIPVSAARVQANVGELTVLEVAVYVNVDALQISAGVSVLDNTGVGLTTTTTLFVAGHPFAVIV